MQKALLPAPKPSSREDSWLQLLRSRWRDDRFGGLFSDYLAERGWLDWDRAGKDFLPQNKISLTWQRRGISFPFRREEKLAGKRGAGSEMRPRNFLKDFS